MRLPPIRCDATHTQSEKSYEAHARIPILLLGVEMENVNTIDECRIKVVRNRLFDCYLSPNWRQMTTETLFLAIF